MTNLSSVNISRIVGYSLFLMALLNWADILFPPQFMNATWELQTVGAFIESTPIILLSLVLIFNGELYRRNSLEKILVRLLSFACLLMAISCFLLIPVAASSTIRINRQIDAQIGEIFSQQINQMNQIEDQLSQASNQDIIEILEGQGIQIENELSESPKDKLLGTLVEVRQNIQEQSTSNKLSRKRSNFKSALKWIIGCLIASFTFLYLWYLTGWARTFQKYSQKLSKA